MDHPSELPAPTTGTKSRSPSEPLASPTGTMRSLTGNENWCVDLNVKTRMHSSGIRAARSLPYGGGVSVQGVSVQGGLCQTGSDIIEILPPPVNRGTDRQVL